MPEIKRVIAWEMIAFKKQRVNNPANKLLPDSEVYQPGS